MKKLILFLVSLLTLLSACVNDADIASQNLSKDADQFKIYRRVVFYNGITDNYILVIEGYCSIQPEGDKVSVIVKTDDGKYLKHYLGLSDNVTYFAEQLDPAKVSDTHYKVIFKPKSVIPTIVNGDKD